MPATTSVSIRSPTIAVVSECASIRFIALRNIMGLGLPTTYGSRLVARVMSAATAPVALGSAADFGFLAGLTVNNVGQSLITGDLGASPGAVVTGFGLGLIEGLTKVFYPPASDIVIFVIMIIVLLIRPAGLFGKA